MQISNSKSQNLQLLQRDCSLHLPGKVVDLLDVQTPRAAAAQCHGDEDAVVDGRPRPGAVLQVAAILQDSLQPPALSPSQAQPA